METYNLNNNIQQPRNEWLSYYANTWLHTVYQHRHVNNVLEEKDQLLPQGRNDQNKGCSQNRFKPEP